MKTIALRGPSSSGKSSTLNLVYDELINNLGAIVLNPKIVVGNPIYNDFESVVSYKSKKIAFYTMGDYAGKTIEAIEKFKALSVDILIIATNEKFIRPLRKIPSPPNVITLKTIASPKSVSNNLVANILDCNTIISHL